MADYKVRDLALAEQGRKKIDWAESQMPVLMGIRKNHSKSKPLEGMRIAGCLHVTKETAVLVETFVAAGAEVSWSGCNPLSTQDDVAAALVANDISVYAWHNLNKDEYYWCIDQTLKINPQLTLDDGADLIFTVHTKQPNLAKKVLGASEETTTGVHRLRAMAADGKLMYPVIAANDSVTKREMDNIFGTGQSALDGVLRATNILFAGSTVVVGGFGHCGRGIAQRARGMGADVIVTEVDYLQALKARMEGYRVMPMIDAAPLGDVFITSTGMRDVITKEHFDVMKDRAILANAGHFNVEVNAEELAKMAKKERVIRENNREFIMKDGRRLYLLGEGRLVNLAAAEGHPSSVMDLSFSNQFHAMLYLKEHSKELENQVYVLPREIDETIARLKLETMGITIDKLTTAQERYHMDYAEGT
ncbi:MAG: adenosylhomocysteinase [Candidatus Odinarchaeota archaeon]